VTAGGSVVDVVEFADVSPVAAVVVVVVVVVAVVLVDGTVSSVVLVVVDDSERNTLEATVSNTALMPFRISSVRPGMGE
jgi:hypothetical protein